jgi:phosphate transport system protein
MKHFEQQLDNLKRQVLTMSAEVESMLDAAGRALVDRAPEILHQAMAHEPRIDQFQIDIDTEAIRLMTIYSPIARDLRFLLMVARINSELERIGDQSLNNCQDLEQLPPTTRPKPFRDLVKMSEIARQMVHDAIQAFNDEDIVRAEQVVATDDEIDALYVQTFRDLLVEGNVDPVVVNESMTMILLARSLERIADHATNISEEVIYLVKGEDIRHQQDGSPGPRIG